MKGKKEPQITTCLEGIFPPTREAYVKTEGIRGEVIGKLGVFKDLRGKGTLRAGGYVNLELAFPEYALRDDLPAIRESILGLEPRTGQINQQPRSAGYKYSSLMVDTTTPLVREGGGEDPALEVCVKLVVGNGGALFWLEEGLDTTAAERDARRDLFRKKGMTKTSIGSSRKPGAHPDFDVTNITYGRFPNKAKHLEHDVTKGRAGYGIRQTLFDLERADNKLGWRADRGEQDQNIHHTKNVAGTARAVRDGNGITFTHQVSGAQVTTDLRGNEYRGYGGVDDCGELAYHPPAPVPSAEELNKALHFMNPMTERPKPTGRFDASAGQVEVCKRALGLRQIFAAAIPPFGGYPDGVAEKMIPVTDKEISGLSIGDGVRLTDGREGILVEAQMPIGGNIRKLRREKVIYLIDG